MVEEKDKKCMNDPYEVLGLENGASRDEVEKKYSILIRKYRSLALSENEDAKKEGEIRLNEVRDAYNSIIQEKLKALRPIKQGKPNPVLKKMGVDEEKAKNIAYYYKYHFIFGLLGILLVSYLVYGVVTKVDPDFNITVIGEFYSKDTESIKQSLVKSIPEIKEPMIEVITVGKDIDDQMAAAMQVKAVTVVAAGDIDVFLVDRENFDKYAKGSAFMNLDEVAEKLKVDKSKYIYGETDELKEKHIYGIDVGSSELLKGIDGQDREKIAAVKIGTENYEKAVKVLELFAK